MGVLSIIQFLKINRLHKYTAIELADETHVSLSTVRNCLVRMNKDTTLDGFKREYVDRKTGCFVYWWE